VPADYAREHLEHAYALTGHAMQGATVGWAAVIARQEQLTKGWAYTALSRAREHTALYVPTENPQARQERAEIAPHDDRVPVDHEDLLQRIAGRMAIRDDEDLATTQLLDHDPAKRDHHDPETPNRPLDEPEHVKDNDPLTLPVDIAIERSATAAQSPLPEPPATEHPNPDEPSYRPDRHHGSETTADLEHRSPAATSEQQRLDLIELRQHTIAHRDAAQRRLDALPAPSPRRWRTARDPHAAERATLTARIDAADHQIRRLDRELDDAQRHAPVSGPLAVEIEGPAATQHAARGHQPPGPVDQPEHPVEPPDLTDGL
jgi:hypothetical protein